MRHPPILLLTLLLTACPSTSDDSGLHSCDADTIQADAADLLNTHAACSTGDSCQTVTTWEIFGDDTCLEGYLCAVAVNADTDLAAFTSAAQDLDDALRACDALDGTVQECLTECDVNDEVPPECNTSTGLCELAVP